MRRIVFVNRFYAPDHSATAQILTDLARGLVERGYEVHVIASQGLYDDPSIKLVPEEVRDGVHVHRVPTPVYQRHNLAKRAMGYISVYRAFASAARKFVEAGDIVVVKTDPPLLSVFVERAIRGRGAHLMNWLQDIYPEIAVQLGVPFFRGPVAMCLAQQRDTSWRHAHTNIVLGCRMAEVVKARVIGHDKIAIIPNWTDDEAIQPVDRFENILRETWGLKNKFVVGYSGNLGRAHEYDTLLEAARLLKHRDDIIFLFVGGGHHITTLKARVDEYGIASQFQFRPYQDHSQLKYSLGVCDIHWLSLRPEVEGLIVPSKFYGIAAAGRPTIAITAVNGEISRLIKEHGCGVQVDPGDAHALSRTITQLADDRRIVDDMGHAARLMIDTKFSRQHAFDAWDSLLASV